MISTGMYFPFSLGYPIIVTPAPGGEPSNVSPGILSSYTRLIQSFPPPESSLPPPLITSSQ